MSKRLFVFGCSYSDRTEVEKCYGDYVAENTGLEYHHCARGGSSNDRSWRIITRKILDGEIRPQDIVIYQPTDRHRREFCSPGLNYQKNQELSLKDQQESIGSRNPALQFETTECGSFYVSDYKSQSYSWQINVIDSALHLAYQNACADPAFDDEYFKTRIRQFECFCEIHSITLIVLWCRLSDNIDGPGYTFLGPYGRKHLISEENIIPMSVPRCYKYELGYSRNKPDDTSTIWDNSHLSDLGHLTMGKYISDYLLRHSLI